MRIVLICTVFYDSKCATIAAKAHERHANIIVLRQSPRNADPWAIKAF